MTIIRADDQPAAKVAPTDGGSLSNPDYFDDEPINEIPIAHAVEGEGPASAPSAVIVSAGPSPTPPSAVAGGTATTPSPIAISDDRCFAMAPVGKRYFQVRSEIKRPDHFILVQHDSGILQIKKKLLQTSTDKRSRIALVCLIPLFCVMLSPFLIGSAQQMIVSGGDLIFIIVFGAMVVCYLLLLNLLRKAVVAAFFATQCIAVDLTQQRIEVVNKPSTFVGCGRKPQQTLPNPRDIRELRCERLGRQQQVDRFNVVARSAQSNDDDDNDYRSIVVGGLVGLEEALYIEQELERFLGLVPTYGGYDREPAVPANWNDVAYEEEEHTAPARTRARTRPPEGQTVAQRAYVRAELKPRQTIFSPLSYFKSCSATVECPKSIQVTNRSEAVLTIERKWRTYGMRKCCTSTAPLLLIVSFFMVFLIGMLVEGTEVESRSERLIVGSIVALVSLIAIVYVILPLLRQLLNTTAISIHGNRLETKVSPIGPLCRCWCRAPSSTRAHLLHAVSLENVKEIRCKGRQSSYEVHALDENEIESIIVEKLPTMNEAIYIEHVISKYIGGSSRFGLEQPPGSQENGLAEIV